MLVNLERPRRVEAVFRRWSNFKEETGAEGLVLHPKASIASSIAHFVPGEEALSSTDWISAGPNEPAAKTTINFI